MLFSSSTAILLSAMALCGIVVASLVALHELHNGLVDELRALYSQRLADPFELIQQSSAQPDIDLFSLKSFIVGFLRHLKHGVGSYQNRQRIHHSPTKRLLLLAFAVLFVATASMIHVNQSLCRGAITDSGKAGV
jgi:hypothetical protein